MQVKVLRAFINKDSKIAVEGSVIDVSGPRADELVKKGLVTMTVGGKSKSIDPFQQRQLGGQIGEEKVAPSLPVDQAPEQKKRTSRRQKKSAK